jgi:hypothetical protein
MRAPAEKKRTERMGAVTGKGLKEGAPSLEMVETCGGMGGGEDSRYHVGAVMCELDARTKPFERQRGHPSRRQAPFKRTPFKRTPFKRTPFERKPFKRTPF